MNPGMAAGDTARREDQGDTAMTHHKTFVLLALLLTATGSHQALAGMSGTSVRVQQQSASEAQAAVQAPPAARPVGAGPGAAGSGAQGTGGTARLQAPSTAFGR